MAKLPDLVIAGVRSGSVGPLIPAATWCRRQGRAHGRFPDDLIDDDGRHRDRSAAAFTGVHLVPVRRYRQVAARPER
jgi:hypothetical protein